MQEIKDFMPDKCFWCCEQGHSFVSKDCQVQCQHFLNNKQRSEGTVSGVFKSNTRIEQAEDEQNRPVKIRLCDSSDERRRLRDRRFGA